MKPFHHRLDPEFARFLAAACRAVAVVAGTFCVAVSTLLIADYVQLSTYRLRDNPTLAALRENYRKAPENEELAVQIRALDLLARRAFFTRQWQMRTGAILLAVAAAALLACVRWSRALAARFSKPRAVGEEAERVGTPAARRALAVTGMALLAAAFLSTGLGLQILKREAVPAGAAIGTPVPSTTKVETASTTPQTGANSARAQPAVNTDDAIVPSVLPATGRISSTPGTSVATAPIAAPPSPVIAPEPELTTTAEYRSNWPQFRGPGGNGIAGPQNPPQDWDGPTGRNVAWKDAVPLPGKGSPVVWGDRVFLSGADESHREIYCWNTATGQFLWRCAVENVPGSPSVPPRVGPDTGFAASTMAVNGHAAFAIFANGDLAATDFNGKLLWTRNLGLPQNSYGYASSLALYGDSVIVQFDQVDNGRLMAIDAATGETRWEMPRLVASSWASPVVVDIDGRATILVNSNPILAAYDVRTGNQLWEWGDMTGDIAPSPAYGNGKVFAADQNLALTAVDAATGKKAWDIYRDFPDVPSPLATGDLLFVATGYGLVSCLDAGTGKELWKEQYKTRFYSSPILAGGLIYLLDRLGVMRILAPDRSPKLLGSSALGEPSDCTPAFRSGRIFIRGNRHLFCIGGSGG